MKPTLIDNARLILPDRLAPGAVLLEDGRIRDVLPPGAPRPAGAEVFDAAGAYLAAGFIDLHIHGAGPHAVDRGPEALAGLCGLLPRYGVTGFLPTLCPRPPGEDARFLASLAAAQSQGSRILGFHLEGPFLSLTGALPPQAIGQADPKRVRALMEAARPYRAVFSVSPEFDGIEPLIAILAEAGAPVFLTHTQATVKQTQAAIEAGARHATHFYDVFPPPAETEPGARPCGAVEAVLADERVSVDFILDGEHVDPVAVQMALRCKGPDRVCLITDANVGPGLPPGRYPWGDGEEIEFAYPGGPARLTERSRYPGGLAGSGLTMDRAVRNAVAMLGLDVPSAVGLASANPARVLGLERSKGSIAPGHDADLVLLDNEFHVLRTWIDGQTVFAADRSQLGPSGRGRRNR